ncbi:MAG: hypothetical protein AAF985_14510 [Bacteroidota bacterium]
MIAIVDSGSTKADWRFVGPEGEQTSISTMGFNPFFHEPTQISSELLSAFPTELALEEVKSVHYYGAGCSDAYRCSIVAEGLKKVFPEANIIVEHDILASARATCGDHPGIACILGTGSNSCAYNGVSISDNVTNLGFLLGDEGSGTHLGKMLIRGYFYRELPEEIKAEFDATYSFSKRDFLNKVYNNESANVYLASFSRFMSNHKDHLYIQHLVSQSFGEFIKRHVRKYKNHNVLPIHFVGSVAYHFSDILEMVLAERNLKMGIVIKKPIDNLVNYHLEREKAFIRK